MGHGNYDDPWLKCHTRAVPSCDISTSGHHISMSHSLVRHLLTIITISAECVFWSQSTVLMFNVMSSSILVCTDCVSVLIVIVLNVVKHFLYTHTTV